MSEEEAQVREPGEGNRVESASLRSVIVRVKNHNSIVILRPYGIKLVAGTATMLRSFAVGCHDVTGFP